MEQKKTVEFAQIYAYVTGEMHCKQGEEALDDQDEHYYKGYSDRYYYEQSQGAVKWKHQNR